MKHTFKEEDLIKLLQEGKTSGDIAKIYNVDIQVIRKRVKKINLPNDICIKYRPSLEPLTQIEIDVLIGGLLGDTWIGYSRSSKNALGSFTHKIEHSEYVDFKYNLLKRLCFLPVVHNKHDKRTGRFYQQKFCKIATNPLLNDIASKFYINKKKTVDISYLEKLTPLGIAIWFMDDGSKTIDSYKFSTDCFSEEDRNILANILRKFNLECTTPQNKTIYIKKESKDNFTNLIKDYVPLCMKYKLHDLSSLKSVKRGNSIVKWTIPC